MELCHGDGAVYPNANERNIDFVWPTAQSSEWGQLVLGNSLQKEHDPGSLWGLLTEDFGICKMTPQLICSSENGICT